MRTRTPGNPHRIIGALAVTAGLALGATACGSDDDTDDPLDPADVDTSLVVPMDTGTMTDTIDPMTETTVAGG